MSGGTNPRDEAGDQAAESTSTSLLRRVRAQDPEAWRRLVDLYGPVIYQWCRYAGVAADDSNDLVQDVFGAVVTHLESFRRDRQGDSFHGWLRTITQNKIRDHFRARQGEALGQGGSTAHQQLLQVAEPLEPSETDSPNGADGSLLRRALESIRDQFEVRTWQAFWQLTIDRRTGAEVAQELGISIQAAYQAKYRVLQRMREEFGELLQ